jgi:hypothetical protein
VAVVAQAVNLHQTEVLAEVVLVVLLKRAATAIHRLLRQAKATMEAPATEVPLIWREPVVAAHLPLALTEHQPLAVTVALARHQPFLAAALLTLVAVAAAHILGAQVAQAAQAVVEPGQIHRLPVLMGQPILAAAAVAVRNILAA